MPIISSTTSTRHSACFDLVLDDPELVTNKQVTLRNYADHGDNDLFSIIVSREDYSRETGEHIRREIILALTKDEFRQLLTMVTDFACNNGFAPTIHKP